MRLPSPLGLVRRQVYMPWARIPEGGLVELGDRGTTYVTDTPGPDPDSPAVVLLHALGCTGLLTWFPTIEPLAHRYRVITLDQRWHGQGIRSAPYSLVDCADDVAALLDTLELDRAIIAGYSMGSVVAQRVWRQHPSRVRGLVLAATTDHFRGSPTEKAFFGFLTTAMAGARSISRSANAVGVARSAADALDLVDRDIHDWAMEQVRSTPPSGVAQAVEALGRHHSRPWLRLIDVPTAVVINNHDRVIPPQRQYDLAGRIKGATIHDLDGGHASCVMEAEKFVPVFLEAVNTVNARATSAERRS